MLTEQEAQNQIKELEKELGVSPTTLTEADAQSEIEALQKEMASLPMTVQEFAEKRKADGEKAFSEKALAFGSTIVEGFKELGRQGVEASDEAEGLLDLDAYGDIINIGSRDFWRFAKTIGGSIMDELGHTNQEELVREYMRYRQNFDYYQKVRPAMLESDEVEYKKLTDFGANFIDPFMAFPIAKVASFGAKTTLIGAQKGLTAGATLSRSQGMVNVAKGLRGTGKAVEKLERGVDIAGKIGAYPTEMASRMTAKALRKGAKGTALATGYALKGVGFLGSGTAKVASAPRKAIEAGVSKVTKGAKDFGGVTLGGQVVGGLTQTVPLAFELGITEGIGLIAKKLGKGTGEVLTTLGQPASNKRFLYRLATNSKVSPKTRKLAMYAYNHFGTAMGDGLFNMMANGLTIGAINAGLAGVAGEDAENMGRAFGAGLLAGGVIPSGQQGMRAGKTDTARDMKSIDNHMKYKLTEDQRKAFKQMPKPAQVMLATLNESGIGAPKFQIMESKAYLEMLNADLREKGKPELTKAPRGHYNPVDRTFYANRDKLPESSAVAMETIAHETGHDFLHQMLGNDPMMLDLLLENYKTSKEEGTAFYYEYDKDGNPLGDPIYLNQMAVAIRDDYDMKQKGKPATAEDVARGFAQREGEMIGGIKLGNNASKLAQEIGADQFAMMFSKDPNAFNHFHPKLRHSLIDASRRLLTVLGMAEPMTGNPLSNPISRVQLNNPALRRLYENYGRARAVELNEKGQLAKDGMLIRPKDGQTGEDRFVEMMASNKEFQSNGLTLTEAKNLRITNKNLQREINNLKKMYKDDPKDTWSVRRGKLIGKQLTSDLRTIFTRNDPFQNVATIIDALQQAIDQGIGIIFGYRSGTKGKYQNPFKIRDVAIYAWEVSGNSLKVLGYDQAVVRHNIQVLVENGYIKDIKDFERQLAQQGQKALADPEGRINPDGGAENTLMTAVFGLKESAENIRSEGIKELLESGKLKKSFRSYDVEALAGVGRGRRKAFTFNYDNIRNNYNPFRQSDEPMFMPALEDAKSIVAEKGRVAENAEDVFFGAMLPKLLRKTGGQLKPSVRNIREATRRAIEDVTPFLRDNPQFADYYNKDMEATRNELDQGYGNVSDDDFLFYRTMLGLTSPGTKLPSNVGDGVNIFNLYKEKGNLDDIKMGTSEKGNPVIASSPFKISGTTAPTKARSLLIVDSLRKELGSVRDAIDFLEEGVPIKKLHQFNKQMGYAGNVAKPGDIRRIVKQATGQDELIPRMFIFGPKVGAYTLNAVGNHNYNTIDVWEARFIRSYFKGMFKKNTGLPANVDEHALFTRFTEIFQEEFEKKTGDKMPTSALQAIRWFYMIDTAKKLGYSGASTNETISGYTKRYITKLRANSGSRRQGDGTLDEGV